MEVHPSRQSSTVLRIPGACPWEGQCLRGLPGLFLVRVGIVLLADGPGSRMTLLSPSSSMSYPSVPTDIAPER